MEQSRDRVGVGDRREEDRGRIRRAAAIRRVLADGKAQHSADVKTGLVQRHGFAQRTIAAALAETGVRPDKTAMFRRGPGSSNQTRLTPCHHALAQPGPTGRRPRVRAHRARRLRRRVVCRTISRCSADAAGAPTVEARSRRNEDAATSCGQPDATDAHAHPPSDRRFRDDGALVGQCLEHDIAVQAQSFPALRQALEEAIVGHIVLDLNAGLRPLQDLPPAHGRYFEMFEHAAKLWESLRPVELDGQAPSFDAELRMVA